MKHFAQSWTLHLMHAVSDRALHFPHFRWRLLTTFKWSFLSKRTSCVTLVTISLRLQEGPGPGEIGLQPWR